MKINSSPRKLLLLTLVLVMFYSSCKKDIVKNLETSPQKTDKELYNALLQGGVKAENIVELNEYYLVEGDMLFKKNKTNINKVSAFLGKGQIPEIPLSLRQVNPIDQNNLITPNKIAQWQVTNLISTLNVENIKVNTNSSPWSSASYNATQNWNNIVNCKIKFYEGWNLYGDTQSTANSITFVASGNDPELIGYYALAEFPNSDNAGYRIRINTNYNNLSQSQKTFIITHELGHCIGLRHTNYPGTDSYGTNQVSGTPTSDVNSIMNSGGSSSVPSWNGFSTYDIIAAQTMYPYFTYDKWIDDNSLPSMLYDDLRFDLNWNSNLVNSSTVSIELFQYGVSKGIIASNIPNNGSYSLFLINNLTPTGHSYFEVQLKIIADSNSSIIDYSYLFSFMVD